MSDWPFLSQRELVTIHSWSPEAMGPQFTAWSLGAGNGSIAWTSGFAYYVPFVLTVAIVARQLFLYNGATAAGNIDLGIYGPSGTRLVSTGAVLQVGTNAIQVVDITDTTLGPGSFYLAFSASSNSCTVFAQGVTANTAAFLGVLAQSSGHPLPATATFARTSITRTPPIFGLTGKAVL